MTYMGALNSITSYDQRSHSRIILTNQPHRVYYYYCLLLLLVFRKYWMNPLITLSINIQPFKCQVSAMAEALCSLNI